MVEFSPATTSLTFFKALADANRLKIIGLLAQGPHTVEELVALRRGMIEYHLMDREGGGGNYWRK